MKYSNFLSIKWNRFFFLNFHLPPFPAYKINQTSFKQKAIFINLNPIQNCTWQYQPNSPVNSVRVIYEFSEHQYLISDYPGRLGRNYETKRDGKGVKIKHNCCNKMYLNVTKYSISALTFLWTCKHMF